MGALLMIISIVYLNNACWCSLVSSWMLMWVEFSKHICKVICGAYLLNINLLILLYLMSVEEFCRDMLSSISCNIFIYYCWMSALEIIYKHSGYDGWWTTVICILYFLHVTQESQVNWRIWPQKSTSQIFKKLLCH